MNTAIDTSARPYPAPKSRFLVALAIPLALSMTMCDGNVHESMEEMSRNMTPANYVQREDEGRVFLLTNDCRRHPDAARACPDGPEGIDALGGRALEGCVLSYQPACGVRELTGNLDEAARLLRRYRWIDVNPSMINVEVAQVLAFSKLINRFGMHTPGNRAAQVRGLILVYLPFGPDAGAVRWGTGNEGADRKHEVAEFSAGKFDSDHLVFQETLDDLIDAATTEGGFDDSIIVTSHSYAGHQVLEVIHDKPNVFWYDLAPTFGLGMFEGDPDSAHGDLPLLSTCSDLPGVLEADFVERDSCRRNPHVQTWLDNLRTATVTHCAMASRGDCLSNYFYGLAVPFRADDDSATGVTRDNTCGIDFEPQNDVAVPVADETRLDNPRASLPLSFADPIVGEDLVFDLPDRATLGPGSVSRMWHSQEAVTVDHPEVSPGITMPVARWDRGMRWFYYAAQEVFESLWHNVYDGPDNTKVMLVEASGAGETCDDNDKTKRQCDDPLSAHAGHFDYYDMGIRNPMVAHGPYELMWDEFEACPDLWEYQDCPECVVADDIAHGRHLSDDLKVSYRRGTGRDMILPKNAVRNDDVIYLPPSAFTTDAVLQREYERVRSRWDLPFTAGHRDQYHLSQNNRGVPLRVDFRAPDDADGDTRLVNLSLWRDGALAQEIFNGSGSASTAEERTRGTYYAQWNMGELLPPAGAYHDMVGTWFTVQGRYTAYDGDNPLHFDGESDSKRVLVMKARTGSGGNLVFPEPVPDVRLVERTPANPTALSIAVRLQVTIFDVTQTVTPRVEITVPHRAAPLRNIATLSETMLAAGKQSVVRMHSWNALATWCSAYPTDGAMCGGPKNIRPASLRVPLEVRAFNSEGNYFQVQHVVTLNRGPDLYTGNCFDGRDNDADGLADSSDSQCRNGRPGDNEGVVIGPAVEVVR